MSARETNLKDDAHRNGHITLKFNSQINIGGQIKYGSIILFQIIWGSRYNVLKIYCGLIIIPIDCHDNQIENTPISYPVLRINIRNRPPVAMHVSICKLLNTIVVISVRAHVCTIRSVTSNPMKI